MASFRQLHSLLQVLSNNDLKRPGSEGGFERVFASLFDLDVQTFRDSMLLNMDQLQKQLDKDEFHKDRSMAAFWVINKQFQMFIDSQFTWDYDSQMTEKYFAKYTRIGVNQMNERQMQSKEEKVDSSKALDASLVVTECSAIESENSNSEHAFNKSVNESSGTESGKQDTSSSSGNYLTHVVDADIRPVNDQVPFAEVQLTAQHNVLANEQQHTEQSEPIYDNYLLEKVDSNTTPDSTNMFHRGGEIDQDAEHYQSSVVHEKPNTPRSCLRWKPTGRIFKIAGLRWIPTGKMFTDCTTKVISEPPNGSNEDITNPYECDQTLNVSAGTLNLSAAGSPSLTTIDQDVPSASTSPTNQEIQSQVTYQGVEELIHGHQNSFKTESVISVSHLKKILKEFSITQTMATAL
ncbi:hypothetical protein Tco_0290168 [Tanacetum coccineum]